MHRLRRGMGTLALVVLAGAGGVRAEVLVVRGETVHTMAGPPLADGAVLVEDGKIVRVGPAAEVGAPEGARVLRAAVVTPGLIDAHSTVGLSGIYNSPQDQEQLETSAPVQPELRAIDAYNGRDELVGWVRSFGVTTVHTGHAPGALISGQTMIIKTDRENVADGVLKPFAMVCGALGEGAMRRQGSASPGTRAKAVAMLRAELIRAREYAEKRGGKIEERPPVDLRLESLGAVLRKEVPLLLTAHRHQDIAAALRLAQEFDFSLVLDGAAEAYLMLDDLRAAEVPVLVHPTMQRANGEAENLSVRTAATLAEAGIPFAFQSGFETYVPKTRVVLFEAAMAVSYGVSFEKGLAALTVDAARLLGIADRVGSLEPGKDADLALYDGDPFEYASHCVAVIIDGRVVRDEPR